MPSDFPNSPRFQKGALVVYESQQPGPPPRVIPFQYNPEQVKRTLEKRAAESKGAKGGGAGKDDVLQAGGPPAESISLSIVLDAADQLSEPDRHRATVENGLYPILASLELLLYPSTAKVQELDALAGQGQVQVKPADLPLVLFVWGKARVVPVLITGFSITEEGFDVRLNPVHAKVELTLKVLTYMELKKGTVGYDAYLSYQRQKEQLAGLYQPGGNEAAVRQLLPGG